MSQDKREFEPVPCDVMVQMKGSTERTPCQCYEHEIPILEDIHGAGSVEKYKRIVHTKRAEATRGENPGIGRKIKKSKPASKGMKYAKKVLNVVKEAARLDAKYGSGRGEIFLSVMNMMEAKVAEGAEGSGAVTMDNR